MHSLKAVSVVAGAVMVLIVGTRLADVRPPVPAGPPSTPAQPAPQPAAPFPDLQEDTDPVLPQASSARVHAEPVPAGTDASVPLVISGAVVDEEGNPVAGAAVWGPVMKRRAHGTCYPGIGFMVESDGEGRFVGTLRSSPPASERGLLLHVVMAGGFLPEGIPAPEGAWDALDAGRGVTGLRVVLRRGAVVEGTVRDADGRTVPGAVVRFLLFGEGVDGERFEITGISVKTDASGEYRHSLLDPRQPWILRSEFLGRESPSRSLDGLLHPDRPLTADLDIPDLHRARITVHDAGASEDTLLFVDDACEGDGVKGNEGRCWEVETVVGLHVVELWNGEVLRIRETVELESTGETARLEVDGGGAVKRVPAPVPSARRGYRGPGSEPPPDDAPPPGGAPPPGDAEEPEGPPPPHH